MKKRILSLVLAAALIVTISASGIVNSSATNEYCTSLAKELTDEGMVLLENDGTLPLQKGAKVAVFGVGSVNYYAGGGGSGNLSSNNIVTPLIALNSAAKQGLIELYKPLTDFYDSGSFTSEQVLDDTVIIDASLFTDTAVYFLSRWTEEGVDNTAEKGDYYLSSEEEALIGKLKDNFKNVIIVLNIGGVMDTSWFKGENAIIDPSAVLISWIPGIQGANSIVDIITGKVNPSGKLVDTFAKSYDDYPSSQTFGNMAAEYVEDIFVGYRYFSTIPGAADRVNYWFGHGLSYTTFGYSDYSVTNDGEYITASVKVTNTGKRAGKDVVAVYYGHPDNTVLDYAAKELAVYQKTGLLDPGQSETVTVSYKISDMAGYDMDGLIQKSAYVLEAGEYPVYIGSDVSTAYLAGSYTVAQTAATEQLSELCKATKLSKRLKADGSYEELTVQSGESTSSHFIAATGTSDVMAVAYSKKENADKMTNDKGYLERFHESGGGSLYYNIDVEKDCTYDLYLSVSSHNLTNKDIFDFYVDGVEETGLQLDLVNISSVSYTVFKYLKVGSLSLTKGKHTIKLYIKVPAAINFKAFAFVPAGEALEYNTPVATVGPNRTTVMNATTFIDIEPAGTKNYNLNAGGYMERYNTNYGSPLYYVIEAEEDCTLDVWMTRAQNINSSLGQVDFELNGSSHRLTFDQPNTGGWANFQLQKLNGSVPFKKGKNVLAIIPRSPFASNVQNFIFLPQGETYESGLGAVGKNDIQFADVVADRSLIDSFVEQFTASEIGDLTHGSAYFGVGKMDNYGMAQYTLANGPAGIREGKQQSYLPCSTLVACTWNTILAYKVGVACGLDARNSNIQIWLAPAINIHRDPLCGRNFEYFSEDPVISGVMGGAEVNGAQYCGVAVTLKHFAANNQEFNRNSTDSVISERALREIYLEGFRIATEASDPWAYMSSYNLLNGTETAENHDLLTGILRNEWGYKGIVFTDWLNNSNQAKELAAGNDIKMPDSSGSTSSVVEAYETGKLSMQQLRSTAKRIIEFYLKLEDGMDKKLDFNDLGLSTSGYVPESWSTNYLNKSIAPIKYVDSPENTGETGKAMFADPSESLVRGGTLSNYAWTASNDIPVGNAGYKFTVGSPTGTIHKIVNISAQEGDECSFWLWVENAANIRELFWEVGSSGTFTGACVRYYFINNGGQPLVDGWNKINFTLHNTSSLSTDRNSATSLSFSDVYSFYLGGGMTGNVDYSKINFVRVCANAYSDTGIILNGMTIPNPFNFTSYEAENNQNISVSGEWAARNFKNFNGKSAIYTTKGGTAKFNFVGDRFNIVSYKSNTQGKLRISIDGGAEKTVNLYDSSVDALFGEVVFNSGKLSQGNHTVTIVAEGKVYIDTVNIQGEIAAINEHIVGFADYEAENNPSVTLDGSWGVKNVWMFSNHSALLTKNGGSATFSYNGYDFSINSYKSKTQGRMYVSIDGGEAVEVDLFDNSVDQFYKETVFSSNGLANGTHTVTITTSGSVYLDSLLIDGKMN